METTKLSREHVKVLLRLADIEHAIALLRIALGKDQ